MDVCDGDNAIRTIDPPFAGLSGSKHGENDENGYFQCA